jgi:hypothetical protein
MERYDMGGLCLFFGMWYAFAAIFVYECLRYMVLELIRYLF